MLASQRRIDQPHIRSLGPKLRPFSWLHPFAKHEEIRKDEDMTQFVYDLLSGCPRDKSHYDICGKPHFSSIMESWRGQLESCLLTPRKVKRSVTQE